VSGIFFDPAGVVPETCYASQAQAPKPARDATGTADFIKEDDETPETWQKVYGSEGYVIDDA